ncbi:MAG: hypothetical protein SGPRY_014764, partial [Prymnesium sp.]
VESLFLSSADAAWLRLAQLTLAPNRDNPPPPPAALIRLRKLAERGGHSSLDLEISHTLHLAQAEGGGEWVLPISVRGSDAAREVEAMVHRGSCEQALLLVRRQGGSDEQEGKLLASLLSACEASGQLPRLLRCGLRESEQAALRELFVSGEDKRSLVLLSLMHPSQAAFSKVRLPFCFFTLGCPIHTTASCPPKQLLIRAPPLNGPLSIGRTDSARALRSVVRRHRLKARVLERLHCTQLRVAHTAHATAARPNL